MDRKLLVTLATVCALGGTLAARQSATSTTTAASAAGDTAQRCAALSALRLPDVRLTDVRHVPADAAAAGAVHVAHCRATGVIGTEIGFSVWLPDEWNGGLVVTGSPGSRRQYANDRAIADFVLSKGYAFAATDKGNTGAEFYRDGARPGDAVAEWNRRVTELTIAARVAVP